MRSKIKVNLGICWLCSRNDTYFRFIWNVSRTIRWGITFVICTHFRKASSAYTILTAISIFTPPILDRQCDWLLCQTLPRHMSQHSRCKCADMSPRLISTFVGYVFTFRLYHKYTKSYWSMQIEKMNDIKP